MANTMTLISSVTVGSGGASTISFTSIPSTYTDLCLKLSARATGGGDEAAALVIQLNSSNLTSGIHLQDFAGTATSTTGVNIAYAIPQTAVANSFSNMEIYLPNYTSTNTKSLSSDQVQENDSATIVMNLSALYQTSSTAISTITLSPSTSTFVQYSNAYLYGIKNS